MLEIFLVCCGTEDKTEGRINSDGREKRDLGKVEWAYDGKEK